MSQWKRFRHVVLPQLAPYLAATARSGLSLVWKSRADCRIVGPAERASALKSASLFQLFDVTRILAYNSLIRRGDARHRNVSRTAVLNDDVSALATQNGLKFHIKHKSYRAASGNRSPGDRGLSIAVPNGEMAALVGPSGCGKDHSCFASLSARFPNSMAPCGCRRTAGWVLSSKSRGCCPAAPSKTTCASRRRKRAPPR